MAGDRLWGGVSEGYFARNEPRAGRGGLPGGPAPPSSRPPPALPGGSASRACLCCGAGARDGPTHPGSRKRPGESQAPASPRACGPTPTAPPPGPLPAPDSAPVGVARLPSPRAPGCFLPLPGHGPSGARTPPPPPPPLGSKPGAGWTGPGARWYRAGQAACPFPERRPVWRCHCPTAVGASPRAPWPRGSKASSTVLRPLPLVTWVLQLWYGLRQCHPAPRITLGPPKFRTSCYPGLLSLLCWVFLLLISSVTLEPALGPLLSAANHSPVTPDLFSSESSG